jgi:hypothetical protein
LIILKYNINKRGITKTRKATAFEIPNISIMPFIVHTWNSKKDINNYAANKYISNEMQRIMASKSDK